MTAKENRTLITNYLKSLGIEPYKLWFERRKSFESYYENGKKLASQPIGMYSVEILKNGFLEYLSLIFLIYDNKIIVFDWDKGKSIDTIKKDNIK